MAVQTVDRKVIVTTTTNGQSVVIGTPALTNVTVGTPGKIGPPGPEGGTPVVAVPYANWPPVNPQPNTLYLRLAP